MTPSALETLHLPLVHVSIGDCAFATRPVLLITVLGSCVSATFFHAGRRAGGMFHAMLPAKGPHRNSGRERPCAFANLAVEAMLARFAQAGMAADELEVKLFGGANTMRASSSEELRDMLDVGRHNVEAALTALADHDLRPTVSDVLGEGGRKLYFNTATGEIWLSRLSPALPRAPLAERATNAARRGR